jgi:hypothetical protein
MAVDDAGRERETTGIDRLVRRTDVIIQGDDAIAEDANGAKPSPSAGPVENKRIANGKIEHA